MEQIACKFFLLFSRKVGYLPHQFSHVHGGTMALGGWKCNLGEKARLQDGGVTEIELAEFAWVLRDPIRAVPVQPEFVAVQR